MCVPACRKCIALGKWQQVSMRAWAFFFFCQRTPLVSYGVEKRFWRWDFDLSGVLSLRFPFFSSSSFISVQCIEVRGGIFWECFCFCSFCCENKLKKKCTPYPFVYFYQMISCLAWIWWRITNNRPRLLWGYLIGWWLSAQTRGRWAMVSRAIVTPMWWTLYRTSCSTIGSIRHSCCRRQELCAGEHTVTKALVVGWRQQGRYKQVHGIYIYFYVIFLLVSFAHEHL